MGRCDGKSKKGLEAASYRTGVDLTRYEPFSLYIRQLVNALLPVVTLVSASIKATRPTSSEQPNAPLYFHRNPYSRSSPREFYGFFSASPDPSIPSTELNDADWHYEYDV